MAITPVIQSISAFSATNGTTIMFNIVGNSELIRSNKVTIYDTDNTLVATNINNSTRLENIIPPNLEGISDGNSYYAVVDVYAQVDAGGESLGTSVGRQFWCLPIPTLVFTAPSSDVAISDSSYNFVARFTMYPGEAIEDVSNKIQSYRFNLYKGIDPAQALANTSGDIFGTGTEITDNIYQVSYNFNGLENNTEYFTELIITTQQGMVLNITSESVSVIMTSETFAPAEVSNNKMAGYIEVKSNITNLLGYTNADFEDGDGEIILTEDGKYVIWGYDPTLDDSPFPLNFPSVNINGHLQMQWSAFFELFDLNGSSSNPYNIEDDSYIIKIASLVGENGIFVYTRRDGNNIWCELYAVQDFDNLSQTAFVQSNTLSISPNSHTHIYMLIRCYNGWYDIQLSTSLPNE